MHTQTNTKLCYNEQELGAIVNQLAGPLTELHLEANTKLTIYKIIAYTYRTDIYVSFASVLFGMVMYVSVQLNCS